MRVRSARLDAALNAESRTDTCRVTIQDELGRVFATLVVTGGTIPADGKAAQMRTFDVEAVDPTGDLIPEDLDSLLAPGWQILVERGTKIENMVDYEFLGNDAVSWESCELTSVVIDGNGYVTLGG